MSKYVIKNCPNYIPSFSYFDACKCEKSGRINGNYIENCKNITDCLLKQIVDECREEIKPMCQIPDGCCGMKNIYSDSKEFAEKLLSYLEIEEVK